MEAVEPLAEQRIFMRDIRMSRPAALSVGGRGDSEMLFEDTDKGLGIAISKVFADIVNFHWRCEQQVFSLLEADAGKKLRER